MSTYNVPANHAIVHFGLLSYRYFPNSKTWSAIGQNPHFSLKINYTGSLGQILPTFLFTVVQQQHAIHCSAPICDATCYMANRKRVGMFYMLFQVLESI